ENTAAVIHKGRRYQRSLSNVMMKLSRYTTIGAIQSSGIDATSWHKKLVTAISSTQAHVGSAIQRKSCSFGERVDATMEGLSGPAAPAGSALPGCWAVDRNAIQPLAAHMTAKTP